MCLVSGSRFSRCAGSLKRRAMKRVVMLLATMVLAILAASADVAELTSPVQQTVLGISLRQPRAGR